MNIRVVISFSIIAIILLIIGFIQSWILMISILNLCLISAIMALGVNIQWGYAGILNAGTMGFVALGGLSVILISNPPVMGAIALGGTKMLIALLIFIINIVLSIYLYKKKHSKVLAFILFIVGFFIARYFYIDASKSIENFNPVTSGYLGGLDMPVIFSWVAGGCFAALAAWVIGRISLNLRFDYLAIATLGISEIIISILKNEEWLSRGVKNVVDIKRPVPYELDIQQASWFRDVVINFMPTDIQSPQMVTQYINDASVIFVKLAYTATFIATLVLLVLLANLALNSPWGRKVRAIRDNEDAASAMGKNVNKQRLQIFILGSVIAGIAGAMLTTYDGQFTPGGYTPLRYTFLIWVMVIVGGAGNNLGSIIGGFLIWIIWIEVEPIGFWIADLFSGSDSIIKQYIIDRAQFFRLIFMGILLLLVMRFMPNGILPEKNKNFITFKGE